MIFKRLCVCFRVICDDVMYLHPPWAQEKSDEHGDGASLPNMASGKLLITFCLCLPAWRFVWVRRASKHGFRWQKWLADLFNKGLLNTAQNDSDWCYRQNFAIVHWKTGSIDVITKISKKSPSKYFAISWYIYCMNKSSSQRDPVFGNFMKN